jgi:cytochrome c biogenesis protein
MTSAERQEHLARPLRARSRLRELDVFGSVWHFFTSVRLALVLILLITGAIFAGTMIDQAPGSVIADSSAYDAWLERARGKYGIWTDVLNVLQLFNVFHTLWFRVLIGLLTANIIICTVNRWKGIWIQAFHTRVRMGDAFFKHARYNADMSAQMAMPVAADRVRRALSRARFRVQTESDGQTVALYGDKNRFSRFGTFLTHLSLVLILAGTVIGGIWGFHDDEFIVAEGTTREVGRGTGLSVQLIEFTDEYDVQGPPKDFRSEIVIYKDGAEVKRGTVRVNSPMSYGGIRFYQGFFGQTAVMDVKDETGKVLFHDSVPLAWQTRDGSRPIGGFILPEKNLAVYVIGPRSGETDPMVPAGEMRVEMYTQSSGTLATAENLTQGQPTELAGLAVTFVRESRFTGLTVAKDPGVNLIWIAAGLMVLGLVMMFYLPPKRVWAICRQRPDGTAEVAMATTAERDFSQAKDFNNLHERVRLALGISSSPAAGAEGGDNV